MGIGDVGDEARCTTVLAYTSKPVEY